MNKEETIRQRIKMTVIRGDEQQKSRDENALLLFVLEGQAALTVNGTEQLLGKEEIALINPYQEADYEGDPDTLLAKIPILYDLISREACGLNVHFLRTPGDPELRGIVTQLLSCSDYNADNRSVYEYVSVYFHLVEYLLKHCLDQKALELHEKGDDRKEQILGYIHRNYARQISLTDLSDSLSLSYGYLSRYFSKTFGMGFSQYLNQVRLQHIYDELIYTDKPITQVSYDNGFTSISLFNRSFKVMYGQTPSKLRESISRKKEKEESGEEDKLALQDQVGEFLLSHMMGAKQMSVHMTASDRGDSVHFRNNCRILNAGTASALRASQVQEHVRMLRTACGFRYLRFWGLFSKDIFLREAGGVKVNYSRLDRIFDFILSAGYKPFIDLEEKPDRINQDIHRNVHYEESPVLFESALAWERTFGELLLHLTERYGTDEMAEWKIEVGQHQYYPSDLDSETYFFRFFESVCRKIRAAVPGMEVGGSLLSEYYSVGDHFQTFLNHWYQQDTKPDFFTLIQYGYDPDPEDEKLYLQRSTDSDLIPRMADQIRQKIVWAGFDSDSLILAEWNLTVSDRNLINDSAFRGAYALNTLLSAYGTVRDMGFFMASDLYAEHYDSSDFLFGGNGLVTKDSLLKPAAFVFGFFDQMYPHILARSDHAIITTNRNGRYRILCHNLIMPNYRYYMTPEDQLNARKMENYFDDAEDARFTFELTDVLSGKYRIRFQRINELYGSVLNAWKEFGYVHNMSLHDIQYLQKMIGPKMELQEQKVLDSVLKLDVQLLRNEVTLISIDHAG